MTHEEKIAELQTGMQDAKDRRHFERYQVVYLSLQGYTRKEISKITGRSIKTIYNYVSAYKQYGMDGLVLGHSPGKPPKLSGKQMEKLADTIANHVPADVGFPARYNWTLALVVAYIERSWEITYTIKGVSLLLHRLGFSYTRPTYTLKKADPKKQEIFKEETFPTLKKSL